MAQIRIGRLLPGYSEVGIGHKAPVRGVSLFDEGECTVIAKKLSTREIAVELICSCLGRELELPIPEPVLLADINKQWFFGSLDVGHPNLTQVAIASDAAIIAKLGEWPGLLQAACFDEWIANPDRGDENLLFDGQGFLLIDHGMAIPMGMKADDWSDDFYNNQLLDVVNGTCSQAEQKRGELAGQARDWCHSAGFFGEAYEPSSFPSFLDVEYTQQISDFLKQRVCRLGDQLYQKLNPLQGALSLND
ncbi:HipA family kinase [Kluyvera cryocrescens]|uniref:HipA family kinase n=1 Tax=Kluyvera cryocrescens TaxID=580 RepID=UPI002DBFEDBA|nr:HipA family kinase [Kluyvera cryocrescens]MEB6631858.1 hypothetical protein [Kluyvera cryocrescens]